MEVCDCTGHFEGGFKGERKAIAMDLEIHSTIRGYHHYKTVWTATIGQTLQVQREHGNTHDVFAVCIKNDSNITVGHVPIKLSRIFWSYLERGGCVQVVVTGPRMFATDLVQGGLDIPCKYIFHGEKKLVKKLKKLLERL